MTDSDSNSEDQDAEFVSLLTENQAALRYYVMSLLPGESQALDVTQQANSTIWKKRSDFEMGSNFKAWIFSVARYEVLNFRKQQARDSRFVFSDETEELMAKEISRQVDDLPERQLALRSCLANLRDSERSLIQHRYFEKATLREYASRVGRSESGLKVSLHRIRNKLQRCIEGKMRQAGQSEA